MNCIFSIPSLLHHFLSFRSSVLPLFSVRGPVYFTVASVSTLFPSLHPLSTLFALLSITFPSAAVIPLLPFSISPPLHLDIDLCSIFFSLSSFAPVSLLHHLPLSFAIYFFPLPPSLTPFIHWGAERLMENPRGERGSDGGKKTTWRRIKTNDRGRNVSSEHDCSLSPSNICLSVYLRSVIGCLNSCVSSSHHAFPSSLTMLALLWTDMTGDNHC